MTSTSTVAMAFHKALIAVDDGRPMDVEAELVKEPSILLSVDESGRTLLMHACKKNQYDCVRAILHRIHDNTIIDERDFSLNTALHMAVARLCSDPSSQKPLDAKPKRSLQSIVKIIELLVERKANAWLRNNARLTAAEMIRATPCLKEHPLVTVVMTSRPNQLKANISSERDRERGSVVTTGSSTTWEHLGAPTTTSSTSPQLTSMGLRDLVSRALRTAQDRAKADPRLFDLRQQFERLRRLGELEHAARAERIRLKKEMIERDESIRSSSQQTQGNNISEGNANMGNNNPPGISSNTTPRGGTSGTSGRNTMSSLSSLSSSSSSSSSSSRNPDRSQSPPASRSPEPISEVESSDEGEPTPSSSPDRAGSNAIGIGVGGKSGPLGTSSRRRYGLRTMLSRGMKISAGGNTNSSSNSHSTKAGGNTNSLSGAGSIAPSPLTSTGSLGMTETGSHSSPSPIGSYVTSASAASGPFSPFSRFALNNSSTTSHPNSSFLSPSAWGSNLPSSSSTSFGRHDDSPPQSRGLGYGSISSSSSSFGSNYSNGQFGATSSNNVSGSNGSDHLTHTQSVTSQSDDDNKRHRPHLRVRDFVPLFRFLNVDVTEADIKAMLSLISGTDDGLVDLEDFWRVMAVDRNATAFHTKAAFDVPFRAFDRDGDGVISVDDLRLVKSMLGPLFAPETTAEISTCLKYAVQAYRNLEKTALTQGQVDSPPMNSINSNSPGTQPSQSVNASTSTSSSSTGNTSSSGVPNAIPPLGLSSPFLPSTSLRQPTQSLRNMELGVATISSMLNSRSAPTLSSSSTPISPLSPRSKAIHSNSETQSPDGSSSERIFGCSFDAVYLPFVSDAPLTEPPRRLKKTGGFITSLFSSAPGALPGATLTIPGLTPSSSSSSSSSPSSSSSSHTPTLSHRSLNGSPSSGTSTLTLSRPSPSLTGRRLRNLHSSSTSTPTSSATTPSLAIPVSPAASTTDGISPGGAGADGKPLGITRSMFIGIVTDAFPELTSRNIASFIVNNRKQSSTQHKHNPSSSHLHNHGGNTNTSSSNGGENINGPSLIIHGPESTSNSDNADPAALSSSTPPPQLGSDGGKGSSISVTDHGKSTNTSSNSAHLSSENSKVASPLRPNQGPGLTPQTNGSNTLSSRKRTIFDLKPAPLPKQQISTTSTGPKDISSMKRKSVNGGSGSSRRGSNSYSAGPATSNHGGSGTLNDVRRQSLIGDKDDHDSLPISLRKRSITSSSSSSSSSLDSSPNALARRTDSITEDSRRKLTQLR